MKFVVFDFCETLINFQTADRFVDFIIDSENYTKYRWVRHINRFFFKVKVVLFFNKVFPELNFSKRMKLIQIRGISEKKLTDYAEQFYEKDLATNLIEPLYGMMNQHIMDNDFVLIASGGYMPYIKVFSQKHKIMLSFATEIEIKDKKITGQFKGKDCLYHQKVVLIEQFLKTNSIQYSSSIAYSDSITDLPLLKWADEGIVVSKHKSQDWAAKNNLKEIIHN